MLTTLDEADDTVSGEHVTHHLGPTGSEQLLFAVWDAIDSARRRRGEPYARQLAARAYRSIRREETAALRADRATRPPRKRRH